MATEVVYVCPADYHAASASKHGVLTVDIPSGQTRWYQDLGLTVRFVQGFLDQIQYRTSQKV
jgi:hypothetical protein